jgi:transcriptional regulator with XRE-family HTH domain
MVTLGTAIGHTIRTIRHEQNLTLRQLSQRSYISLGHISDAERGDTDLSYKLLDDLATKGLRIPTEELMKAVVAFMEQENK